MIVSESSGIVGPFDDFSPRLRLQISNVPLSNNKKHLPGRADARNGKCRGSPLMRNTVRDLRHPGNRRYYSFREQRSQPSPKGLSTARETKTSVQFQWYDFSISQRFKKSICALENKNHPATCRMVHASDGRGTGMWQRARVQSLFSGVSALSG